MARCPSIGALDGKVSIHWCTARNVANFAHGLKLSSIKFIGMGARLAYFVIIGDEMHNWG
jgi:hypothetical protein